MKTAWCRRCHRGQMFAEPIPGRGSRWGTRYVCLSCGEAVEEEPAGAHITGRDLERPRRGRPPKSASG